MISTLVIVMGLLAGVAHLAASPAGRGVGNQPMKRVASSSRAASMPVDSSWATIRRVEAAYRGTSSPSSRAAYLAVWEEGLVGYVLAGKGDRRKAITEVQPDTSVEHFTRCTISPSSGLEGLYKLQLESVTDRVGDKDGTPRLDGLAPGSILRFSGRVPYPFEPRPARRGTAGSGSGSWLAWSNPDSTAVTNSELFLASPAEWHVVIEGDPKDPLTFLFAGRVGMVYLHGRGSVVLAGGERVVLNPPD